MTHRALGLVLLTLCQVGLFCGGLTAAPPAAQEPFVITVVDEATGRGVPLVELRTVNEVVFITDSAGVAAVTDIDLLGRKVFFTIGSHGYEFPADGFGIRGKALEVQPGAEVKLPIKRVNIAERLYRITGGGLYRDSLRAGKPAPIKEPLLNAQVLGQDSVHMVPYRGKLYWFWGDTNRLSYPLGQFSTSGATSLLPGQGGLDPAVGVDLTYFTGPDGFSRKMVAGDEPGLKWIDAAVSFRDVDGEEKLVARCQRMKSLAENYDRRLVLFNNETEALETVTVFDERLPLQPDGNARYAPDDDGGWIYFCNPFPMIRVRPSLEALQDQTRYEAYTCLADGATRPDSPVVRQEGQAVWTWKKNTAALPPKDLRELIQKNKLKATEVPFQLIDAESKQVVQPHTGDVHFNAYRNKWVMIALQIYGKSSLLGEVWYAEADDPWTGPWSPARKIVTHDKYSFYNVRHHVPFDQENGRYIYFEGTYTNSFSGNPVKTPRYDYNQIMYRLDLADPRLSGEAR